MGFNIVPRGTRIPLLYAKHVRGEHSVDLFSTRTVISHSRKLDDIKRKAHLSDLRVITTLLYSLWSFLSGRNSLNDLILSLAIKTSSCLSTCCAGRGGIWGVGRHEAGTSKMLGATAGLVVPPGSFFIGGFCGQCFSQIKKRFSICNIKVFARRNHSQPPLPLRIKPGQFEYSTFW